MSEGEWADAEIYATLATIGLTPGADADLPDEARFVRRVREILGLAADRHGPLASPAVFVLAPAPDSLGSENATFHRRMHTGEVDPGGRAWFVGAAARSG